MDYVSATVYMVLCYGNSVMFSPIASSHCSFHHGHSKFSPAIGCSIGKFLLVQRVVKIVVKILVKIVLPKNSAQIVTLFCKHAQW